jgi:iron(III) transport system ATP-binding protein
MWTEQCRPADAIVANDRRIERTSHPVLELRRVSCSYDPGRPAIENISFSANEGDILCLLGPSGCGKTTTLRAIAGFEPIVAGEICLQGTVVSTPGMLVPAERRRVGMVFQEYALFPHLRVFENIGFGLQHLPSEQRTARVRTMLEMVGLIGLERRYPHELSGGQQQRVALARALAHEPVILLLDEPFSNLDPDMAGKMQKDLHRLLRQTKTTAVLVTHDHEEAFAMADRIAVLNNGRLEQIDAPEVIYHTPSSPFVADFVGQTDFIPGVVENSKVQTEIGVFPNRVGYQEGSNVVVMIRPDDICIIPHEEGSARILSRQFRGSENLYTIRLQSGQIIHSSEASTSIYPVGAAVKLSIIGTHIVLFERRQTNVG